MSSQGSASGRWSARVKALSAKVRSNEIHKHHSNISGITKKFQKLSKHAEQGATTDQLQSDLETLLREAKIGLEIFLLTASAQSDSDVKLQVNEMRTCVEILFPDDQNDDDNQPPVSEAGKKADGSESSGSISMIADEIEGLELEIELKALKEKQQKMNEMNTLQAQLEKLQRDIQQSKLIARKQQLETSKQVLEEHGVDEREDIANALDARTVGGAPPNALMTSKPSAQSHASSLKSEQSDVEVMAKTIAKAFKSSKLPPPKPKVFSGSPTEFMSWEKSFRRLVDEADVDESDKLERLCSLRVY